MLHNKCNVDVVSETIKLIDLYRSQKDNSIYDHFYHSHLDCMEELLIDWKRQLNDCYIVIACRDGHIHDSGETSPTYATVCMKPHWDSEGIMFSGSLYDATKFNLDSEDLTHIFKYIKNRYKDKLLELVVLPKIVFGSLPRECWSVKEIRGDFDKTGKINGIFVKEVDYED